MAFKIEWSQLAEKELSKLPKEISSRIVRKVDSIKENPFHFFERLTGREEYKLRVGDYRIIADIDRGNNLIKIVVIGHRKNIYQDL